MRTLADQILHELRQTGPRPFAWFMERALYDPEHGYYAQPHRAPGRAGDFYTSVSVGSLFGELLAWQFAAWLEDASGPQGGGPVSILEAGAHDGALAADVLAWIQQHRPALLPRLQYLILEPLAPRAREQQARLKPFRPLVRWLDSWDQIPFVSGVVFSNELLDAFPVHRLVWDARARAWDEWGVQAGEGGFGWGRLGPWTGAPPGFPAPTPGAATDHRDAPDLGAWLPDGFTVEVSPAATAWWAQAARRLRQGRLLTIDYGLEGGERFAPHRCAGTLRGYRQHRQTPDPLVEPGSQDLTAHVDFDALRRAGEQAGLRSEPIVTQAVFLTRIVAEGERTGHPVGPWTRTRARQLQTLVHPGHLGASFRVLLQSVAR